MADVTDRVARAYARLAALKEPLSSPSHSYGIDEVFVEEYHGALKHLEDAGFDVAEFRIPMAQLGPHLRYSNYLTGEAHYTETRYVAQSLFLAKLDAILTYFTLSAPEKQKDPLGFHGPRKG